MKRHFFNPRLREGGDNFSYDYVFLRNFSIHASAKEATFHPRLNLHYLTTFQSTPPRRRRLPYASKLSETLFFQSTPPRRRRPENAVDEEEARNFQSTPPRRRRQFPILTFLLFITFSIHASAKEATLVTLT